MPKTFELNPTIIRDNCGTFAGYRKHQYYKEITCIPCNDAYLIYKKEWAAKNKDSKKSSDKKYYGSHKEQAKEYAVKNKERILSNSRARHLDNPEKRKQNWQNWYKNNKDHVRTKKQERYKKDPDKFLRNQAKRRALKLGNGHEPYTVQQVLDLYGSNCHICKTLIDLQAPRHPRKPGWEQGLHIDHVIPIANGGPDTIDNVRPAHGFCNISKGAKMTEEFEQEIDPSLFEDDETITPEEYDDHLFDEDDLDSLDEPEEDDEYEEE